MDVKRFERFVKEHRIRIHSEPAEANPCIEDWPGATHWRCKLTYQGRQLTVHYSMGSAHTGEPEIADVLRCLVDEAVSFENARDFEDWARELGFDPDSRKAERIFRQVEKNSRGLKRLLGDAYDHLLWHVKRL